MCLVAFAINASSRWPLVIASNRDEFVARPTLPLAPWTSTSGQAIVSGRDLRAGGTWLGLTPAGRLAFVTNVREAQPLAAPRSRGELVTRWLEDDGDAASFVAALRAGHSAYAGFNLVLGDFQRNTWTWVTNRSAATPHWQVRTLAPGVYGLSNAQLDTPWPKTLELKRVLSAALQDAHGELSADQLQAPLWAALVNRERAAAGQFPETGVAPAFESALSSAFVDFPEHGYGTRSSTLLLASAPTAQGEDRRWDVLVEEKTHQPVRTTAGEALPIERCQLSWQQAQPV
ncbi:MAG: NRDE family protein [Polaromonas sp.]